MRIEKLDNKGRGICFIDNKITFVENALENEEVDIEITNSKSKFNEAKVIKYNKISNDRVEVKCPYYDICGGCDLLHLKYDKELEFKLKKVNDILKKFGGIDYNISKIVSPLEYNYRNKATFHVKEKIGYYKKKSYEIIPIDSCLLVDDKINNILNKIKKFNLKNIYEIVIRIGTNGEMLIIKTNGEISSEFYDLDLSSIILYENKKYKVLKGLDHIITKLGNLEFIVSPDSFFQVNTKCAEELYNKVLEYANLKETDNVLDLYCGTGTIGLFLANNCNYVTGIEINKYAVEDAIKNKKLNHIRNIDFICDDATNVNTSNIDVVIVDPPRSGLNEKLINYLISINSKRIVYVSCDPVTLARDLKMLKEKYDIVDITLFNMFSKTEHVETVCSLTLK